MLPDLDTHAAALKLDRAFVLKRAERRAQLLDAARRSEASLAGIPAETATARGPRLVRRFQSFRWVLRPAHA